MAQKEKPKKTKVTTVATYDGDVMDNALPESKTRKEKSFEECVREATDGMFISIDRTVSQKDKKGIMVSSGYLDKVAATEDVAEYVKSMHGGGVYCLRLRDEGGNYVKAKTIKIAGYPNVNEEGQVGDEEDEVARMQKKVKVARSKKDLKEAEKELEVYEDESGNDPMAYVQAMEAQHKLEVDELKKEFERKQETDKLRGEIKESAQQTKELIASMQKDSQDLIKSLDSKPKIGPEGWAKIIGAVLPVATGIIALLPKKDPDSDWRKMKELIEAFKPNDGESANLMKENMKILIDNMQSGQEMAMKQMVSGTTMMLDFTKKGMESAIEMGTSGGTSPNIKMEIVKRLSDAAKEFMNNIFAFNTEKLGIEKKKLDLIKQTSAKRIPTHPTNENRSVEMEEGDEIEYEEPPKVSPEKEQMALLANMIKAGIERGENPQFIATHTHEIVSGDLLLKLTQNASGKEVMDYFVDTLGFDNQYRLAYQHNTLVKDWVDSWLMYLKGETPSEEQAAHFHKKESPIVGGYEVPPSENDEEAEIEEGGNVDLSEGEEEKVKNSAE